MGLERNIYITDGYVNSRVAKFDKDGNWLSSFGEPGTGPGQYNTLHSIAIDNQDISVADRNNRRIQVSDTSARCCSSRSTCRRRRTRPRPAGCPRGGPMQQMPGSPWAICITPGPEQVLYVSDAFPGRIYKLSLEGKVLGYFGRRQAAGSSAGSMSSRAPRRTSSMWRSS